jgi:DNA (cytosine-5)-methyltransferase 1
VSNLNELARAGAAERSFAAMPVTDAVTYGSLCSGIEAATAAWHPLGWRPAFFAEIEPFPCAVLAHHYPHVPNLGDMTKIDGADWRGKLTVLVAGTPCQAFSVAGLRKSLADRRGNLTLTFVEIVHDADPEFVVWENVPGVLSTKDNAFGCFLAGLVGETEPLVCRDGSWPNAGMVAGPVRTAAWRVLDAQFFGLAQRRRRVFVVSCRTGDGHNPGAVLFEPESLPRDSAPSRETGARVAASLTRGADSGGAGGYAGRRREDDTNIVGCLDQHMGGGGPDDNAAQAGHLIAANNFGERAVASALTGKNERLDGDTETFIVHSLRADGFDASEDGTGRGTPIIPIDMRQASRGGTMTNNRSDDVCSGGAPGTGIGEPGDPAPSLSLSHPPAIAFDTAQITSNVNRTRVAPGLPTSTLAARGTMHVAYGISSDAVDRSGEGDGTAAERAGLGIVEDASPALRARPTNSVAYQCHGTNVGPMGHLRSGNGDVTGGVPFVIQPNQTGGNGTNVSSDDVSYTLDSKSQAVAFQTSQSGVREVDAHPTLDANNGSRRHNGVVSGMAVRRLTPIECERLQGFSDCYTRIPMSKSVRKAVHDDYANYLRRQHASVYPDSPPLIDAEIRILAADGPRYRALGNSMAVPCMAWIGERIVKFMAARRAVQS